MLWLSQLTGEDVMCKSLKPQRRLLVCAVALILVSSLAMAPAFADDIPALSGMALIEGTSFLVVHDVKAGQGKPTVAVLTYVPGSGMVYEPLTVAWPERAANDLESIYALYNSPREFYVAESGSWTDRATGELHLGRVFHARLAGGPGNWSLSILASLNIPSELHEIEGMVAYQQSNATTEYNMQQMQEYSELSDELQKQMLVVTAAGDALASAEQIPQDFTAAPDVQTVLVFGTRGGGFPYEPAQLLHYVADFATGELTQIGSETSGLIPGSTYLNSPWARGITDLYLDSHGILWISSAVDTGDGGPFDSYVSRYGPLGGNEMYYYGGSYYPEPTVNWRIAGMKIEALGAAVLPGTVLSFGTDDEDYGGCWRPLGPAVQSNFWP
jgi:hypothetical protein